MNPEKLITYFNGIYPLTKSEKLVIHEVFKSKKVLKGHFLLEEGAVSKLNSFIAKGCMRMYRLDANGKEHNLQFAVENWWIGDIRSFYQNSPSNFYIQALETTQLFQITRSDQFRLFEEYPLFNRRFRVITENALVSTQERVLGNQSLTAKERYLSFAKKYPYFLSRIQSLHIASYLGITPEFLSTLKKQIFKA